MLQADLKVLGGKYQGKLIPLTTRQFLVGREQDCHLRPNSDLVSRHHCIFLVDDYTVRLRDLGSTNGTRVNGELVRQEVVLSDGDKISIGKLELQLVMRKEAPVAATVAKAPPTPSTPPVSSGFDLPAQPASLETQFELPTIPPVESAPTVANVTSDTAIINAMNPTAAAYPAVPPGYVFPPGALPGYPAGYPMGYPGYPPVAYPGGYPPVVPGAPGYAAAPAYPVAAPPATAPNASTAGTVMAPPIRLPPPESTGVAPPPAAGEPAAPAAPAKQGEKSSTSAADIIKQYMQRRASTQ
jgi:predicted component of type VI protein secretion system